MPDILVVGAGLAGVSAAHALALRAASSSTPTTITVVDSKSNVALATSFANAGRFCPTSLQLGSPAKANGIQRTFMPSFVKTHFWPLSSFDIKSPYQHHMNVNFKSPNLIYWGLCNLFLKNKVISNRGHILLALQAQKDMSQILKIMPLESKKQMEIRPGTLYCYYDQNHLSTGKNKVDEVNHNKSYAFQMLHLDTKETISKFPWLQSWKGGDTYLAAPLSERIPGTVYVPTDWSADARSFVIGLKKMMVEMNAAVTNVNITFHFNTTVRWIDGNKVRLLSSGTEENEKVLQPDIIVLACGLKTNQLLRHGKRILPMEGMMGHSIDLYNCKMSNQQLQLPNVAIADYSSGDLNFQITPYTNGRIRLVGFADFNGGSSSSSSSSSDDIDIKTNIMLNHLHYLLPSLTWEERGITWTGLRPMTPDNLPYVGRVDDIKNADGSSSSSNGNKVDNEVKTYVCCGHGATGWTSCTATASVLAEHVFPSKDGPSLEMIELMHALRPDRFAKGFGSFASSLVDTILES
jgi:glycine/D-amino acid oxidase-like deaminating enzyme